MTMTATASKIVTLRWRDNGRPKERSYTLEELREIATTTPDSWIDHAYTVDVPGGPLNHAMGRTSWSDPSWNGASRTLWINGDLNDLVAITERMLGGETFESIWNSHHS